MDNLGPHRAALMATIKDALNAESQHAKAELAGQADLFGVQIESEEDITSAFAKVPKWSEKVWLDGEKETLGLYLTGHPINQYLKEIKQYTDGRLADLTPTNRDQFISTVGLVIGVRVMTNKKGRRWGIGR